MPQIEKKKNYQLRVFENLWMYFLESINTFNSRKKYHQLTHSEY